MKYNINANKWVQMPESLGLRGGVGVGRLFSARRAIRAHPPTFDASPLCSLGLTPRETEVLTWIAQGKTNYEIGVILGACTGTICKHVERILRKLCVENRTAAAAIAFATLAKLKKRNVRIPQKAKTSMTFGSREGLEEGLSFLTPAGGPGTFPPASILTTQPVRH